ncbi:MAG: radical SAM protein [Desulfovibrio sp.]|nr:MAG: radical SAM protein [Desulfovibrio sp.]
MISALLLHTDSYYLVRQVYPYGLDLIAAHLRRNGLQAEIAHPLLPGPDPSANLAGLLERTNPDVIGLGLRNIDTTMACEEYGDHPGPGFQTLFFPPKVRAMVAALKELAPDIPIIAGGCGFSVAPAELLEYLGVEFGVVGEGEEPLLRFMRAWPDQDSIGTIPGLVQRKNGAIQRTPREPYEFSDQGQHRDPGFAHAFETTGIPVRTRRGCNRKCSYCVEPLIEGRKYRFRETFDVVQELQTLAQSPGKIAKIFFADTEFNLPDEQYAIQLMRDITKAGLDSSFHFATQVAAKPFSREFAELAAELGLALIMSCESFADEVLAQNGIEYQQADIERALELCEQTGLDVTVNLIFGLPGETWESVEHTVQAMQRLGQAATRRFEYTVGGRIYPSTPLAGLAAAPGAEDHIHGPKHDDLLAPRFYCSPAPPLELKAHIDERLEFAMEFRNRVEPERFQALAMCYQADHGDWDDAAQGFAQAPATAQASSFDYLFRTLAGAGQVDAARVVCRAMLAAGNSRPNDPVLAEPLGLAQFYMGLLPG